MLGGSYRGGMITRILSVSAMEEDHAILRTMLKPVDNCEVDEAITYRNVYREVGDVCVVICEARLPDGGWKDILEDLSLLPDPPPLIVTSRFADEHLWAEVLNLGGYDVLLKPFDRQEVFRIVTGALRSRQREITRRRKHSERRQLAAQAAVAEAAAGAV